MSDLEIPDRAWTAAMRITMAAELRRLTMRWFCWTDQRELTNRADELDPPERTN